MITLPKIYTLKDEAVAQLYGWFDGEIRSLPKGPDGKVDPYGVGLVDNDVDDMRHAFVSGVYTLEYDAPTAEMMGRLNEWQDLNSVSPAAGAENMDLWSNAIGRDMAKRSKTHRELYELLLKKLQSGELIT